MLTLPRIQSIGACSRDELHRRRDEARDRVAVVGIVDGAFSPARSASSSVSLRPCTLGPNPLRGSSDRSSSSRLVPSLHAAPLIADNEMRCSVPSMPCPCG